MVEYMLCFFCRQFTLPFSISIQAAESVIILFTLSDRIGESLSRHLIALKVLVIGRDLIDQLAVDDLHDTVCGRLYDLMVTGGEDDHARELLHSVVQGCNGLHVQMVRRLIEHQHVRAGDHHLGEHAAHLLTTGENLYLLYAVFTGKQHSSEESADICDILFRGVLGQPVYDRIIIVELCAVILREVRLSRCETPFVASGIRLHLTGEDLEECGLRKLVRSYKGNLVLSSQGKGNIVENLYAVDGLCKSLNGENLVSDLTGRTEVDIRVFSAGRADLVKLDLL